LEIFDKFLSELPHKYKVVVPGNHDLNLDKMVVKDVQEKILPHCTAFLVDQMINVEGINIYGSPWNGHGKHSTK
jgi:hypothetical protein